MGLAACHRQIPPTQNGTAGAHAGAGNVSSGLAAISGQAERQGLGRRIAVPSTVLLEILTLNNSFMTTKTENWKQYKRKGLSEMRPYITGEDVSHVSISDTDKQNGSPKGGDMIARNPKNHEDQWLVAQKYFEENLEPA